MSCDRRAISYKFRFDLREMNRFIDFGETGRFGIPWRRWLLQLSPFRRGRWAEDGGVVVGVSLDPCSG